MRGIWNFISTISILVLAFAFIGWYVKGHFGKYFILFWTWTALSISMYVYNKNHEEPYDHRTGAEIWEENQRNSY